ncbi:MAG: S-layer protein domain-containing protein [Candidatus Methanoperedens sp.]|nr:S-layer protein domain-containing protein [Candidatus Methanoperedens sp.]
MMEGSFEHGRLNKVIPSMIIAAAVLLFVSAMLVIFSGNPSGYTPITDKCILCHNDTGYPADTNNDSISAPYKRPHNNTIMCEACHTEDLHNIVYIQGHGTYGLSGGAATCLNCHQEKINNSNFTNAPIIPALKHSSNPNNGTTWGTYWNSSQNAAASCYYCHGDTKHNVTAIGGVTYLLSDPNNIRNGSLSSTTWCADCHLNGSINPNYRGDMWSPAPPLITVNNTGKAGWINHSTFLTGGSKDSVCKTCHALNGTYAPTSLNYSHSLDVGLNGGKDCIACHNIGSGFHNIDIDAVNLSVHSGMNARNATNASVDALNGACWACHDTDGNISNNPASQVMGDIYNTPKKCIDCHLSSGIYHTQSVSWGGLTVSEHYFAGDVIKAGNSTSDISSCITCHENVSEMILPNNDPDTGTFVGDGSRLTGGNMSFYHYGKPRPDIRIWESGKTANCSYCHQNASTAFAGAMANASYNTSIQNHTAPGINSPNCYNSTCHGSGWIHNSTLTRPSFTSTNSTYCQKCHSKEKHNNTLNCNNCHIDSNSSDTIHPIKYLQTNKSYLRLSTSAVNCTNCHQNSSFWTGSPSVPIIPGVLKHSSNVSNGSIWNNTSYWTSNSGSCYYCHGNTKHNQTALGTINFLLADTNNTRNGTLSNTKWCADCHINTSNANYSGTIFPSAPPLITIDNTGKSYWTNHSTYFGTGIKDSTCRSCHAMNGNYAGTSLNYSHSLDPRTSGPDCLSCHDTGKLAQKRINNSAMNGTDAVHRNLNSNAINSSRVSAENKKCWGCHDSTGSQPSNDSMGSRFTTPYKCYDCHNSTSKPYSNVSTAPNVSEHFRGGDQIRAASNASDNSSSCLVCHNLGELKVIYAEDDSYNTNYSLSSHYGKNRTDLRTWNGNQAVNCSYCHQNSTTIFETAMADASYNKSISNHSTRTNSPNCYNSTCHDSGWIHNSTLTRPSLDLPNSTYCISCHTTKQMHNGSTGLNCTQCHIDSNSSDTIHPIKYMQTNGSFQTSNTSAVNCTSCHQTLLANFSSAPHIPGILKHSSDPSSGMKWGNYWNNSSAVTACYYCHQSQVHLATGLIGNITSIKGSNNYNDTDLGNSTWCSACHYNDSSSNYKGDLLSPVPPEILNSTGNMPQNASDGTTFYNHSEIQQYDDGHCKNCHGSELSGYIKTSRNFVHSVSEGGGGPSCVTCHNTSGTGSPIDKRVDVPAMKQGVHRNLNLNAVNTSNIDPVNKACWACHGDGTEPSGHPAGYRSPRKCESSECHSISQSAFNEKMVYSHFMNASLNSNPENATNYNITTSARCQECHINSVVMNDGKQALAVVSHYGTKDELVDSFNCRYCHLDKENSEDWGDATLINRNRTGLIELEKERNLLKVSDGESVYLGEGYYLKLKEITPMRDDVIIQVLKGDMIVDETALGAGILYKYETELIIDNSKVKTPVIILNITSIFKGTSGFIQFEGFRIKKVHNERESRNNTNCLACHLSRYSGEKKRYIVIDREYKENSSDNIFYSELFVDFNQDNKSKIYFSDEDSIIAQFLNGGKYFSYPKLQKYLKEGDTWNIADNYALKLNEVSTESKLAWMNLTINGAVVEDAAVPLGYRFNYTPGLKYKDASMNNITVFTANVSAISQGAPNFVILTGVYGISPQVVKITSNSTLFGYNSSWLRPGETLSIGKIPENLHAPNLFTDQGGWDDCVKCHDASWKLGIAGFNAISTRLGKHSGLNRNASSGTSISDTIDKACWACHTGGEEPTIHSPTYIKARKCASCHTYQEEPTYGAKSVGDELHGLEQNCENCHYWGSHNIIRFEITPGIKAATLSPEKPVKGEKFILTARAFAGYRMTIKDVEYFIDDTGISGTGTPLEPVDGVFDSQKEDVTGVIDTTNIPVGKHVIYIHVMERTDKWSDYYPVDLTIVDVSSSPGMLNNSKYDVYSQWSGIIYLIIVLTVAYFAISKRRH